MKTSYIKQIIFIFLLILLVGCKKHKYYEGDKNTSEINGYNNENYYPSEKMDSIQTIYYITNLKLQQVYDLAILSTEKKLDKDIDTILVSQLQGYFAKDDTISIPKIIKELDSIKVNYIKIDLDKTYSIDSIIANDSIRKAKFKITYYDKNKRYLSTQLKEANYILKKNPKKFKYEFKFYFSSIENWINPEGKSK